jgi:phosphatidylglycerophosphate synthase
MSDYKPTSRRPIADVLRRTADGSVKICVSIGIHPDAISYNSMIAALMAGLCFWQSGHFPILLIPAALFCYFRLWLNMLDGMVALASGKASLRGELLNDLPDRFSDIFIFVGVAHSGLCNPFIAYGVAICALLVAYVGMFGLALGVQREFSGLMAKPWRMVTLHIGAWITLGLIWLGGGNRHFFGLSILDWTDLLIIAGCVQTIWIRLIRIVRSLRQKSQRKE